MEWGSSFAAADIGLCKQKLNRKKEALDEMRHRLRQFWEAESLCDCYKALNRKCVRHAACSMRMLATWLQNSLNTNKHEGYLPAGCAAGLQALIHDLLCSSPGSDAVAIPVCIGSFRPADILLQFDQRDGWRVRSIAGAGRVEFGPDRWIDRIDISFSLRAGRFPADVNFIARVVFQILISCRLQVCVVVVSNTAAQSCLRWS